MLSILEKHRDLYGEHLKCNIKHYWPKNNITRDMVKFSLNRLYRIDL